MRAGRKCNTEAVVNIWIDLHLSNPPLLQSLHLHPLIILHFSTVVPGGSEDNQDSACNAGDPGLIPGWEDLLEKEMATHSSRVTKSRTGLKELGTLAPQSFTICVFPPRSSTWTPWNLLVFSNKLLYILLWSLFPLCCCCCCCWVALVVSDSVRPQRQQPTRLPCPWDSPGKNTGVGCHFLLQSMKVKSESQVTQSCLTLSDPMDRSLSDSSAHGIFQARVLEWGAIAFSCFHSIFLLNMVLHFQHPLLRLEFLFHTWLLRLSRRNSKSFD